LHVAFSALDEFNSKFKRYPLPKNDQDASEFFKIAQEISNSLKTPADLGEDLIKTFSHISRGYVCPMAAVIGGFVAQEVLKVHFTSMPVFITLIRFF
jgi:hypothetical protein